MTDAELTSAMVETARVYAFPCDPGPAFVEAIRVAYDANFPRFVALGFDAETARFLACALAAREMHLAGGAVGRG
jgi:hypothetical protein